MRHQDTFSVDEIHKLLKDLDIDASLMVDGHADESFRSPVFACAKGRIAFRCVPGGGEVNFGHLGLIAIKTISDDPFEHANLLNSELLQSVAHVLIDEFGELECNDEGDAIVMVRRHVLFGGGVTVDHLRTLLSYWMEDLYVFFGLDESVDSDDTVADGSVRELGLAEQIEWLLGHDGVPRTARQVASFLMRPKHEVNSELYRNSGTFTMDDSQPPRWTVARI